MTADNPERYARRGRLRAAAPQVLTAARVMFGAAAVVQASEGRLHAAAALITLGAATDILDGFLARRLGVAGAFGALFDTFSDYLCFVVAPWTLTRALAGPDAGAAREALLGLPLLTGALRYARNSLLVVARQGEVRELPGLATVFYAFVPVAAVFLDARALVGGPGLSALLTALVTAFSLLMVTSIRYPKLGRVRGMTAAVLVPLVLMPFFFTRAIACALLVAGLLYVALAPLLARARASAAADADSATARRCVSLTRPDE